ncbi:archaetidylserine decarboxylase [Thioalkalicoccus limnaeus]|uniref:Phosphatidylserine decarboxylase proenzyme n=1 Tax=Thioalkalicoccus limnaeus TaxID=120681 RepID=A0ABV4BEM8_9GAMM
MPSETSPKWWQRLFIPALHLLPHHPLSRAVQWLTRRESRLVKNLLIGSFIRLFRVDLTDAQSPHAGQYPSFNAFFTRSLRAGARPLDPDPTVVLCPVDGRLSQFGPITSGQLLQAKGHRYDLTALLGHDPRLADQFAGGTFATIYLSPRDYHRIHMPADGRLQTMHVIGGRLFSVNETSTQLIPNLFVRNERLVCVFETAAGPMALILVGALFVGSIETVWSGPVTPPTDAGPPVTDQAETISLARGAEMGRFNMGSTVILIWPAGAVTWVDDLVPGRPMRMGEALGHLAAQPSLSDRESL